MLKSLAYRLSPFITKWFCENYGRRLIALFLERVAKGDVVLDLGAGGGDDLQIAKSHFPNSTLWAVETYPPYVKRMTDRGINVCSLNIENDSLPFEDGTVDIIIINQVLEHTKEIFWVLHECTRVLRKGGVLIVGVPNLAAWHNRVMLLIGIQPPAIATLSCHVRGFTCEDIKQTIMRGSGGVMVVRQSASAGFYPFPPMLARPLAKLFPTLGWSVHCRVEKTGEYARQYLEKAVEFTETNFFVGSR